MTNIRRPFHLQLRPEAPSSLPVSAPANRRQTHQPMSPKALSPTAGDSLPTQILPHLFVGNQEQTNRDTINRLNIKYILSLGLLPMVSSASATPTSGAPQTPQTPPASIRLPNENCSRDFKIRVRSNTPTASTLADQQQQQPARAASRPAATSSPSPAQTPNGGAAGPPAGRADENKGVKAVRSVHCKCINISDSSDQLLAKFFDEAHAFIDEARRRKCNILIHCLAGISRSPTFAIAYLMRLKALHWQDAYDMVKQRRPQIDPNLNFMGQLRIYNRSLRDQLALSRGLEEQQQQSQQQRTPTTAMARRWIRHDPHSASETLADWHNT